MNRLLEKKLSRRQWLFFSLLSLHTHTLDNVASQATTCVLQKSNGKVLSFISLAERIFPASTLRVVSFSGCVGPVHAERTSAQPGPSSTPDTADALRDVDFTLFDFSRHQKENTLRGWIGCGRVVIDLLPLLFIIHFILYYIFEQLRTFCILNEYF